VQLPLITKDQLREQMRQQLATLSPQQVRSHSAGVWERLSQVEEFKVAKCISAYVSKGNEIETHGLIRQLLAMRRHVCVPASDGPRYLLAELRDFDSELVEGKYGILEPRSVIPPAVTPEAWVIPGLAFDLRGNRLGRGMGFFDALLREARGVKIALAHDFQILNEVPAESHDAGVDFIVTETRVVETKRN